jgi:hypothetical protein
MSTILKALKKLEQDKAAPGAREMSHAVATAAAAKSWPDGRLSGSKLRLTVVIVAAALIGVCAAAVFFNVRSKPAETQEARFAEADPKPVPPRATAPVRRPVNRSDTRSSQSIRQLPQTKPAGQREAPPGTPGPGGREGGEAPARAVMPEWIEALERLEQGRNLPEDAPPVGEAASETAAGPAPPAAEAPSAKPKSKNDSAYANVRRLRGNRLKIQAIAWSPIPDERMSVINSHIVHEGDNVEGFTVVKIRSDDVIVREKGQLYRIVFGSP